MPFMMLLTSCDTDADLNGIMLQQQQWQHMMLMWVAVVSQDQNNHVISNFYCHHLRNALLTLRMLTAL